jgi:hypothetical protein
MVMGKSGQLGICAVIFPVSSQYGLVTSAFQRFKPRNVLGDTHQSKSGADYNLKMRRVLWLPFLLTILSTSVAVAEERGQVDIDKPMIAGLSKCLTANQLDCIESVNVLLRDGKRLVANQVSVSNQADKDDQQQEIESGESSWEYTNTSGVSKLFVLSSKLTTPPYVVIPGNYNTDAATTSDSEAVDEGATESEAVDESDTESESVNEGDTESETTEVTKANLDFLEPSLSISANFSGDNVSIASRNFLNGERLEIVIRTSWLQIEEVFLPGKDSEIEIEKTAKGKRITLRGSEDTIYSVEKRKNPLTGALTETIVMRESFEFLILHPKSNADEKQCFQDGYKITSTNGSSLSLASEVQNYSLTFYASGYPFKTDKSANKGYAKVRASLAWLSCKFPGNDFTFAKDFTVKVYSIDRGEKLQNTPASAIVKDGFLELKADDFLFARTEIRVVTDAAAIASQKAKAEAEAKAATDKADAELKAKQEAEAKAAAELKAKQEAEAKAAAELKAKQEAEAKAAAELKAKQEAEAKAAAELKAKQEAEAKAALEKAAAELKAKQEAEAKAALAAKKKITITCVKGKLTKKVTAVKPTCPKGYKKK